LIETDHDTFEQCHGSRMSRDPQTNEMSTQLPTIQQQSHNQLK